MISSLFLTLADAAAPPAQSPLQMIIPFACVGVIFYFLIIRPQNKRQSELKNLISTLKTGDKVVTNSGIYGIIANVKEGTTLILKIADNVKIEIDKSAIASVDKGSEKSSAS
ncbi:MAG: preprotein translocase subunit YajC [Chthoniobacter sp.]|uniref:preprotein translocase subunit YajC n=1 Tax=Chthoniobacter sp. TaxID=2510640 RepID=UPI0032A191AF